MNVLCGYCAYFPKKSLSFKFFHKECKLFCLQSMYSVHFNNKKAAFQMTLLYIVVLVAYLFTSLIYCSTAIVMLGACGVGAGMSNISP